MLHDDHVWRGPSLHCLSTSVSWVADPSWSDTTVLMRTCFSSTTRALRATRPESTRQNFPDLRFLRPYALSTLDDKRIFRYPSANTPATNYLRCIYRHTLFFFASGNLAECIPATLFWYNLFSIPISTLVQLKTMTTLDNTSCPTHQRQWITSSDNAPRGRVLRLTTPFVKSPYRTVHDEIWMRQSCNHESAMVVKVDRETGNKKFLIELNYHDDDD